MLVSLQAVARRDDEEEPITLLTSGQLTLEDGRSVLTYEEVLFCTRLKTRLDEEGGEISLHYQMDLNGQFAAAHEMEIRLMRQNEAHE